MSPLDPGAVRRAFGRAARSYAATAVLQREVEDRLLERLELLARVPERILDLGCGPGRASEILRRRFPKAQLLALDAALPMLAQGRRNWWRPVQRVCAEAEAMPLAGNSIDLVFSNLCVQWCPDLQRVLDELRRVLRPEGLLLLSSFGPDTLKELRAAWSAADAAQHVNRFVDMPVLGDALMASGFRDPVLDLQTYTLTYRDAKTLMRELKAIGASNAETGRARGLTGKSRLARVLAAYEGSRREGVLPATYEVICAQAFAPRAGQPRRTPGGEVATFPLDTLRGSRRPRP